MKGYTFADVLTHTEVTRSQLIHWTNVSLITPSIADTAGTGHHRRFSFRDLVAVRIAVLLARGKISVAGMRTVFRSLSRPLRKRSSTFEVVWLSLDRPGEVWLGSIADLGGELRQRFALRAEAGLVVHLAGVIAQLESMTGDRWEGV